MSASRADGTGGRSPRHDPALVAVLEQSRGLGYLGPGPLDVAIEHSLGFAAGVTAPAGRVLDLGSGGGVPGLVLAAVRWPESEVVLMDAIERRCHFLEEAVETLGLSGRVTVVRARAEEAGREDGLRGSFDTVVARSFGPPPVTAECGAPFLAVGGRLIVSEPPTDSPEQPDAPGPQGGGAVGDRAGVVGSRGDRSKGGHRVGSPVGGVPRWPDDGLALVGLAHEYAWSQPFHYRSLVLERTCPGDYPRRVGVPAKRPLF
jgi:16S rRNA (guanine527-N7)-methyltransferase